MKKRFQLRMPAVVLACVFAFALSSKAIPGVEAVRNNDETPVPVVLFPAFHFTKLKFIVRDRHVAPDKVIV